MAPAMVSRALGHDWIKSETRQREGVSEIRDPIERAEVTDETANVNPLRNDLEEVVEVHGLISSVVGTDLSTGSNP